jgi:hypothetical protein
MTGRDLDRIAFRENLRRAILPTLVFVVFAAVWVGFSLNVPVRSEEVFGKVLNTIGPTNYENPTGGAVLIELEGGRVVSTAILPKATLPKIGQRVTVVRYINKFFGDSFGLVK